MSDNLLGGVKAGATSISLTCVLRSTADSTESTGKVAADMTLSYLRQGSARVAVSPVTDLAAITSVWAAGGVKEADSANMPGAYRIDWPDAAFAAGADWVHLSVKVAADFVFHERIPISSKTDANLIQINGDATAAANIAKTTRAIGRGTVGNGSSTTSIATSAFTPNGGAVDQFKGRIVTFDADTATVALRGQSTDITGSTNAAAPVFTVSALSTAPSSGDTFSVT